MQFGPRALGARSILGDPRSPRMQATMNLKIKFREASTAVRAVCAPRARARMVRHASGRRLAIMLMVAPVLDRHRVPVTA
jgi:carbamoyltransferase